MIHPSCLNIDGERVEYKDENDKKEVFNKQSRDQKVETDRASFPYFEEGKKGIATFNNQGRHPSQLYISEEIEMEGSKLFHKINTEL